jgi:hypothetical protein
MSRFGIRDPEESPTAFTAAVPVGSRDKVERLLREIAALRTRS